MKKSILALAMVLTASVFAHANESTYSCTLNDQSFRGGDIGFGNREVPLRFRLSLGDSEGEKQLVMSFYKNDLADADLNRGSTNDEFNIEFKNDSWNNKTKFGNNTGINLLKINGSTIYSHREEHYAEAGVSVYELTKINFDEQSLAGKLLEVGNVDSLAGLKPNIYKLDFTCKK